MSEPTVVSPPHPTMSINFALMVRIRGNFSAEELGTALARVRARHMSLFRPFGPNGPGEIPSLDQAALFPLEERTGCQESDWIDVVRSELHRPFPAQGPFARFILLRLGDSSDLVAIFHHWAAEGMLGMYMLRDILRLLGEPAIDLPPLPLPPDPTDLLPKTATENPWTRFRVWRKVNSIRLSLFFRHLGLGKKQAPSVQTEEDIALKKEICILPGSLTIAQTSALLARCRAERTSVHAALCTAWLRAHAEMLETRKTWVRKVSSPFNIRGRLTQPVPETGSYLTIVETSVSCAPGRDFWQIAREFKQKLVRDSADDKLFVQDLTITSIVTHFPVSLRYEAIGSLFDKGQDYDFSITNLGQVDIPAQVGALQVQEFRGPLVNSNELERTVGINTFAGKLTYALLFRRSQMDVTRGGQLMQRVMQHLEHAVDW